MKILDKDGVSPCLLEGVTGPGQNGVGEPEVLRFELNG